MSRAAVAFLTFDDTDVQIIAQTRHWRDKNVLYA